MSENEEVKISESALMQLSARQQALAGANVLVQMAKREFDLYVNEQLKELGLDLTSKYNIDHKTGVVSELKVEPLTKEVKDETKED